jgi:hypothetical protein
VEERFRVILVFGTTVCRREVTQTIETGSSIYTPVIQKDVVPIARMLIGPS